MLKQVCLFRFIRIFWSNYSKINKIFGFPLILDWNIYHYYHSSNHGIFKLSIYLLLLKLLSLNENTIEYLRTIFENKRNIINN